MLLRAILFLQFHFSNFHRGNVYAQTFDSNWGFLLAMNGHFILLAYVDFMTFCFLLIKARIK